MVVSSGIHLFELCFGLLCLCLFKCLLSWFAVVLVCYLVLLFGYLVFSVFGGFGGICLITQLSCSCVCSVALRCSVLLLLVVLVAVAVLLCLHCCLLVLGCCFGIRLGGCFIVVCCLTALLVAVIFACWLVVLC